MAANFLSHKRSKIYHMHGSSKRKMLSVKNCRYKAFDFTTNIVDSYRRKRFVSALFLQFGMHSKFCQNMVDAIIFNVKFTL